MFTLNIDGRDLDFREEADLFKAAEREFDLHGAILNMTVSMDGHAYIGPAQMRHWWKMKKDDKFYGAIPY
jgi:hypothetical protein